MRDFCGKIEEKCKIVFFVRLFCVNLHSKNPKWWLGFIKYNHYTKTKSIQKLRRLFPLILFLHENGNVYYNHNIT